MDLKQQIILIKKWNEDNTSCGWMDCTSEIESIELKSEGEKYVVKFLNSSKRYTYNCDRVHWCQNPESVDLSDRNMFINGHGLNDIKSVRMCRARNTTIYVIEDGKGHVTCVEEKDVRIRKNYLTESSSRILAYLRECINAGSNEDKPHGDRYDKDESGLDVSKLLADTYSKINFIDDRTAASVYLNRTAVSDNIPVRNPVFPFGCNASQEKAVRNAISKQISVIQGPPGTGKTQTILNIIANLLIAGKTVLIVSNNNHAVNNIKEKLDKHGFGFLVAPLGNNANKTAFLLNQPQVNPDLPSWRKSPGEMRRLFRTSEECLEDMESLFKMRERLVMAREELAVVEKEKNHFWQENEVDSPLNPVKVQSRDILGMLIRLQKYALTYDRATLDRSVMSVWNKMKNTAQRVDLGFRLKWIYKMGTELSVEILPRVQTMLEYLFYVNRISELRDEIGLLEKKLSESDEVRLMKTLTDSSMAVLKAHLSTAFDRERSVISEKKEFYTNGYGILKDFPIVLSTTFSSRQCFGSRTLFDYVIMDEASQVPVETGLLALTCAKNAVIVGDIKQLQNIVPSGIVPELKKIKESFADVADVYDTSENSFLKSVLSAVPDIPEILLREHYRCHPDIIGFCNQHFYKGELLIMTRRGDNDSPLTAVTTGTGHHERNRYNQREIDVIKTELLPEIKGDRADIGIISPYNNQIDELHEQLPDIEAATVHKYQGREKDVVILSVTGERNSDFLDSAELVNVAVSRAKNRFCLVMSDKLIRDIDSDTDNTEDGVYAESNLKSLFRYICYNNGEVYESAIRSIYDYLSTQMSELHPKGKMSVAEKLTAELIEKILDKEKERLPHVKVMYGYQLRWLIKDMDCLTERERQYVQNQNTHIDFLFTIRSGSVPVLAVEVDGYSYHNKRQTEQYQRDRMKDRILKSYGIPLLRLSTVGHSEEQRLTNELLKYAGVIRNNR